MKVRAIALNTFASLLRNKIIILFCAGCVCVVLLLLSGLLTMRNMRAAQNAERMQMMVLPLIAGVMSLVSGFGSLLAAWSAADAVAGEMRSGTVLAVLARPVRRWEFLLGKFLGVQMMMFTFVLLMCGMDYLLAWIGGAKISANPWVLLVYPMARYMIYSALGMLLVTVMHPILAFCVVLVGMIAAGQVAPGNPQTYMPEWLRSGLFYVLPSSNLLSETRFLTVTRATLEAATWSEHLTALVYAVDYTLVCFVLAAWIFHSRSLARD